MIFRIVYKSGQIFLPFCHGRTDRQTEFSSLARVCIPCSAVKVVEDTLIYSANEMWPKESSL